jgi:hypothetical protein
MNSRAKEAHVCEDPLDRRTRRLHDKLMAHRRMVAAAKQLYLGGGGRSEREFGDAGLPFCRSWGVEVAWT